VQVGPVCPPRGIPMPRRKNSVRHRARLRLPASGIPRKWPPQDSLRSSASRHINSASSKKSATRRPFRATGSALRPSQHLHLAPVLFAQTGNLRKRQLQPFRGSRHATYSHISLPSSRWKESTERVPLLCSSLLVVCTPALRRLARPRCWHRPFRACRGHVVVDGIGQHEVAVGQACISALAPRRWRHGRRNWPRRSHTGRNGGHQVVVHPKAAHSVVDGRVDAHRLLVRIFAGDALVHVDQVAVALFDDVLAQAVDGVAKIEIYGELVPPTPRPSSQTALALREATSRAPGCRNSDSGAPGIVALGFRIWLAGRVSSFLPAPTPGRRCAATRSSA